MHCGIAILLTHCIDTHRACIVPSLIPLAINYSSYTLIYAIATYSLKVFEMLCYSQAQQEHLVD